MSQHTPDGWAILEQEQPDKRKEYFVFGSWSGSYLYGDSWRANSGIKNVEETDDSYLFHGYSGSVYRCSKHSEGRISAYNVGVMTDLAERSNAKVVKYDDVKENF